MRDCSEVKENEDSEGEKLESPGESLLVQGRGEGRGLCFILAFLCRWGPVHTYKEKGERRMFKVLRRTDLGSWHLVTKDVKCPKTGTVLHPEELYHVLL